MVYIDKQNSHTCSDNSICSELDLHSKQDTDY